MSATDEERRRRAYRARCGACGRERWTDEMFSIQGVPYCNLPDGCCDYRREIARAERVKEKLQ